MNDAKAFLEHIEFISVQAMHDDFKDSTHIEYDTAIRRLAESLGFEAFSQSHSGISVKYYGAQNMKSSASKFSRRTVERYNDQNLFLF